MDNLYTKLMDELRLTAESSRQWARLSDEGAVLTQAVADESGGVVSLSVTEHFEGDTLLALSMTISSEGEMLEVYGVPGDSINPALEFLRIFWVYIGSMDEFES